MEQIRLNKYLAQCGICSRREADKLIEQGKVTINGIAASMGQTVTGTEKICVNRKPIQGRKKTVVLAYNKPIGVTCTEKDRFAEKIVTKQIAYADRVTYAGRLDKDSEGLLLLTNDGDLIQAMMKGVNRHEKEYVVRVDKEITPDFLSKMASGVFLSELEVTTRACKVEKTGKYTFRIILTQGLNRQIRRMCKECGCRIRSLKRIRVVNIELGDLKPGCYREVVGEELRQLYANVGMVPDIE